MRRFAALAALTFAACAGPALAPIASFGDLGAEEVVIVGKVKLTPPLRRNEQDLKRVIGDYEDKAILILDDAYVKPEGEPGLGDMKGRIETVFGDTFFLRRRREPFFIRMGMVLMTASQRAYMPGGLKIAAAAGDKAVYIGTIHYHRDEFFNVQRVTIDDEFDEAEPRFKKRFGSGRVLRKALAVAVRK